MTAAAQENPFALLERNSADDPRGVFARTPRAMTTNGQALETAKRLAFELRWMGVRPGDLVALQLPDLLNALFTEALYHEAAVGCTLPPGYPADGPVHVGLAFTSRGLPVPSADRVVEVDRAFLQHVEENPSGIRMRDEPVEMSRVLFTSGSTGRPRAVRMLRTLGGWIEGDELAAFFTGGPALMLMDFSTVAGLSEFLLGVRARVPFHSGAGFGASEQIALIERAGLRVIKGSPAQVADLVTEAERQGRTIPSVERVLTAGMAMPTRLAERVLAVTEGCTIVNLYGSTEGGSVAARTGAGDPSDAGELKPDVELEIVDDDDQPLPRGAEGAIRYRTGGMATEYLGDPRATAERFRDGWFVPGDRGMLRTDGGLTLLGRDADILNAGGVKIDATRLDEAAAAHPGVEDAAAFEFEDDSGARAIGLAVRAAASSDLEALAAELRRIFRGAAPSLVVRLAEVPRTRTLKPARHVLTARFTRPSEQRNG